MGKMTEEYCFCDCCKKIFTKDYHLIELKLPCRTYLRDGSRFVKGLMDVAFCETCFSSYWELSDKQFARATQFLDERKIFPHIPSEKQEEQTEAKPEFEW